MRHNSHWAKWEREMKWDLDGIQQEIQDTPARTHSIAEIPTVLFVGLEF